MGTQLSEYGLKLIDEADWDSIALKVASYADRVIRKHVWYGAKPGYQSSGRETLALADGRDGQDFMQQAIHEMLDPDADRTWVPEKHRDIQKYLMDAVKSMISNASRHSKNQGTRRLYIETGDPEKPIDRLANVPTEKGDTPEERETAEEARVMALEQKDLFDEFKASVSDNEQLTVLIDAYYADRWKNREVEELTGIPAARVGELKRMFDRRMNKFLRTRKAGD
jgi:hypothetical protein